MARFVGKESCEDAMTTYIWPQDKPGQILEKPFAFYHHHPQSALASVRCARSPTRYQSSPVMSFVKLSIFGTSFEVSRAV